MKKVITFAAALLIAISGTAFAQRQETIPKPAAAPAPKAAAAMKEPMDINTASAKDLASLPKIGEARAKAILNGRPYNGKDDLINKKIIPQDAYDAIKDVIVAKQANKAEPKKEAPKGDEKKK